MLGVFALGLAAMSGILIAPQAFAQEAALTAGTPAAQLSHTKSIQPSVTKPVYVIMNSNDYINGGITHSTSRNAADVTVNKDGSYIIIASGQVGKTSGNTTCNVDFWLKQNGQVVANSNTRYSVNSVMTLLSLYHKQLCH